MRVFSWFVFFSCWLSLPVWSVGDLPVLEFRAVLGPTPTPQLVHPNPMFNIAAESITNAFSRRNDQRIQAQCAFFNESLQAQRAHTEQLQASVGECQRRNAEFQLGSLPTMSFEELLSRAMSMQAKTQEGGPSSEERGESSSSAPPCFVAGTWVFTTDLKKPLQAIELLREGDEVWSCQTGKAQCVPRKISRIWVSQTKEIFRVMIQSSELKESWIETTGNHPFYLEGDIDPKAAQDLRAGDELWGFEERVEVKSVEIKPLSVPVSVFNVEVEASEGENNYFVSEQLVLVHNCTGDARVGPDCAREDAIQPSYPESIWLGPLSNCILEGLSEQKG